MTDLTKSGKPDFTLPDIVDNGDVIVALSQSKQWGIDKLNVGSFWQKDATGKDTIAWVFDTEVVKHIDLPPLKFQNYAVQAGGKSTHGSHVAGIISAMNNNIGTVGVGYGGMLSNIVVLGDNGSGAWFRLEKGLSFMLDKLRRDVSMKFFNHVANFSLGATIPKSQWPRGIVSKVKELYNEHNVVFVGAAGNAGHRGAENLSFPSVLPEFISTGSISINMDLSSFSSWGSGIDIVAPGDNIVSTVPKNRYRSYSGTSMASPFVSGIVMLMWSLKPELTNNEIYGIITGTAIDIKTKGEDKLSGFGIINPKGIVDKLLGESKEPDDPNGPDFSEIQKIVDVLQVQAESTLEEINNLQNLLNS